MATGDQNDMEARLRAVLPGGWFATTSPALGAVLAAFSWALAWGYALVQAALASVLITTAPDFWLNLHAVDYLGDTIQRRTQEGDSSFRARVLAAIFPPGATRAALIARLTILTGTAPTVFEPTQPQDTGAYGTLTGSPLTTNQGALVDQTGNAITATPGTLLPSGYYTLGYSVSGGYGSLALPFQAFITIKRPLSQGVPLLAGYTGNALSTVYAPLGYGTGLGSYVDLAQAFDGVTDADIYQTVAEVEPAGSIVWTRITS